MRLAAIARIRRASHAQDHSEQNIVRYMLGSDATDFSDQCELRPIQRIGMPIRRTRAGPHRSD